MTAWSDSSLMAFADGELGAEASAQLQAALPQDSALQDRLTAITRQRLRLAAAFSPVLDEPVPDRLSQWLRSPAAVPEPAPTPVIDLASARAAKAEREAALARAQAAPRRSISNWAQWGGMAASVVLGVLVGSQWRSGGGGSTGDLGLQDGKLVASGAIEKSLATQLASDNTQASPVAVQLSFVDKSGQYCRTFSTGQVAGLACQKQGQWAVQQLTRMEITPGTAMRQAGSALPRAVLDAVDQQIRGEALNADGERAARAAGWKR